MFEEKKLTKNLKEEYHTLLNINNRIKKLNKEIKPYIKKMPKKIKQSILELINIPTTIEEIIILESSYFSLESSLTMMDSNIDENIFLDILYQLKTILLDKEDKDICIKEETFSNTYYLLQRTNNIKKLLNTKIEGNDDIIYQNILDIIKKQNPVDISTITTILDNISIFIKNPNNLNLLNDILILIKKSSDIKSKQINKLFGFYNYDQTRTNDNAIRNIKTILNYIDIEYDDKKIDKNLLLLIETINNNITINEISQDLLKILLENIKHIDKDININIMIKLLLNNDYLYLKDKDIQSNIIYTIMYLDIPNEEYKNKITKIISIIISNYKNNKNIEINEQILNKLKEIKSIKSLDLLLDTYDFLNKYTKEEDILNIIKTFPVNNNLTKKLIIPISK